MAFSLHFVGNTKNERTESGCYDHSGA